ncbi:hypothetical protein ACFSTH_15680 [Paenibacillus yanchengensis]|uniref:Type II secretion system protein GspF domain-containing protein n=1 Tax=Paenibacillus yanchengensis TaxID=2035833 RepID=A0ABW4YFI0_9BACL
MNANRLVLGGTVIYLFALSTVIVLIGGWITLLIFYWKNMKWRTQREDSKGKQLDHLVKKISSKQWKEIMLVAPFYHLLYSGSWHVYIPLRLNVLHVEQRILREEDWSMEQTKQWLALTIGYSYLTATGCSVVSILTKEWIILPAGLVIGLLFVVRLFVESSNQVTSRKIAIVAALPGLVSRLVLLIGAGETVQRAFIKIGLQFQTQQLEEPLPQQWQLAAIALQHGQSFEQVLEKFNKQCAVQEIATFSTILLLNYKRGGDQLVVALKEQTISLWETRKNIVKTKGEEASSKLVFPLVLLLFTMIVLIAAPAVMIAM